MARKPKDPADTRTKVSYSQYSIWAGCPQNWKLQYIDGHKDEGDTIHTMFGTCIHEVIQDWLKLVYEGKADKANSIDWDDSLKEKMIAGFKDSVIVGEDGTKQYICDKPTLEEFYVQGTQIISYLQQHQKKIFPNQNIELLGVEYPIDIEVQPNVWYTGYIDILTRNTKTGKITIYDLKSSSRGWTQAQKSDKIKIAQLLLYKKFIAEMFAVSLDMVSVEFVILKRTIAESSMYPIPRVSSFQPPHMGPSIKSAWSGFQTFLNECFTDTGERTAESIVAKPSKSTCKYCAFKSRKDLCSMGVE